MSLSAGTRLGPYEILSALGAGGMGEVYRARDAKLNRDVALKILPEVFASDADRLTRFRREAQVLASLNHPNIGHIYGFEDSGSSHALVLELVEGPTLADRIAQGPIPLSEAVPIAKQIADALEAAHEHGVVHRDLKPANIKVKDDGTVKVLDFGLAKALDPTASSSAEALNSPTLTALGTQMGIILGTAAYMAPEQAKGKAVDRRADIWAFGAVLFEMLSGQRAFRGDDISDTLAAVLRQDVDWSALPASTPAAVRRLIARCLERDVKKRLRDIGEARIVLEDPAASEMPPVASTAASRDVWPTAPRRPLWRRAMPVVFSAIVAAALGSAAAWSFRPPPSPLVMRFPLTLPDGQSFSSTGRRVLDLSSDGTQIVITSNSRLYIRSLSELDMRPIQGIEGFAAAVEPTFSPDGLSVAFWAPDRTLNRIAVTGGAAVTICPAEPPFGISWGADGITFGQGERGIMRVSGNGGKVETLVAVKEGEVAQGPQILPGGQHVLFTLATGTANDRWDRARIVVQALNSGEPKTIIDVGSDARYLPTGHIVYALGGSLFAVAFDLDALEVRGGAVPVVQGIVRAAVGSTGAANFAVSRSGSLIYRPGQVSVGTGAFTLALTDKKGGAEPLKLSPGPYETPRVSPDGTRIAFQTSDAKEAVVWIFDLAGGAAMRRLTFGGNNRFPVWSGDGKHVAFQSDREGDLAIFWQPADGSTAAAERLTKPNQREAHVPQSWSTKSETLLFDVTKGAETSLWTFSLPDRKAMPFGTVRSATQTGAVFSPDGRWVAYNATVGTTTLYVEPFPRTEAKYQLFANPGGAPHEMAWSPDGRELYYNPRPGGYNTRPDGLESVSVTTAPRFAFGNPVTVPRPFPTVPPMARRTYDVMPDGRFVGLLLPGQTSAGGPAAAQEIQVVLNWTEELKARVPSRP